MPKKETIYINDKKEFKTGLIILTAFVSIFMIAYLVAAIFAPEGPYRPKGGIEEWGGVVLTILTIVFLWTMYHSQWKKLTLQEYVSIKKKDMDSSKYGPKIFLISLGLSIISASTSTILFIKSITNPGILFTILASIFSFTTFIGGWFMIKYLSAKGQLKELQKQYPQEKIL